MIIACFNYGSYLGDAVKSALSLEGGASSVVVTDDGSAKPATGAALEQLPSYVELSHR